MNSGKFQQPVSRKKSEMAAIVSAVIFLLAAVYFLAALFMNAL